ncbi:MAG: hypothetical protein LBI03_06660 [Clostridiales bacterium]|nr:hypothetical protein [Clostridiales bacterium]
MKYTVTTKFLPAKEYLANWLGNGYAAIELYSPFDPNADKFKVEMRYPILRKAKV